MVLSFWSICVQMKIMLSEKKFLLLHTHINKIKKRQINIGNIPQKCQKVLKILTKIITEKSKLHLESWLQARLFSFIPNWFDKFWNWKWKFRIDELLQSTNGVWQKIIKKQPVSRYLNINKIFLK